MDLHNALRKLKEHECELRGLGVQHAAVFGSVARGDARPDSDIDVLIDLDPSHQIGLFEYARLKLIIGGLLDNRGDVVNRKTLRPLLRESILHDSVNAF